MGSLYHISSSPGSGTIVEEGSAKLSESEAVRDYKETVSFRYNGTEAYLHSQRLMDRSMHRGLHWSKADVVPAERRTWAGATISNQEVSPKHHCLPLLGGTTLVSDFIPAHPIPSPFPPPSVSVTVSPAHWHASECSSEHSLKPL